MTLVIFMKDDDDNDDDDADVFAAPKVAGRVRSQASKPLSFLG